MISLAFVNGERGTLLASDPFLMFEKAILDADKEIDEALASYNEKNEKYTFESSLMGEQDEEMEAFLEAEGANIFDKIGNKVIEIFKKFQEMINNLIQGFKDLRFRHKSYDDKLEYIKKQNPQYADAIIAKIQSNELAITDIKGLADIQKAYNEIIEMSKKKEIDPNTLRGKVEAFKKKCENIDRSALVKVAKAAAVVIGVGTAALQFKKQVLDVQKTTNDINKMGKESYENLMSSFNELKKMDGGKYVDPNALTKAEIDRNLYNYYQGKLSKMISRDSKTVGKLSNPIEAFIRKHGEKAAKDRVNALTKDADAMSKRQKKEADADLKKKIKEAQATRAASEVAGLKARAKWDKKHPEQELDDDSAKIKNTEKIAAAQQRGRNSESLTAYNQGYLQQKGKNKADREDKPKKNNQNN